MTIVLATESFYPTISGVAVSTGMLAETLIAKGHDVWVFAPSTNFSDFEEDHPRIKHLHICRFKSVKNPFRGGHRVSFLPKNLVFEKMRSLKPDLVHLQDPNGISSATLKAAQELKIPVVVTNHFTPEFVLAYLKFLGPAKPMAKRKLIKYLCEFYNKCNAVITPSHMVADMLTGWGVKPSITAISNGVSTGRFSKKASDELYQRYHLPKNKPIILHVGRIDRDKSIHVTIEAIPEIVAEVPAHFVFVGKGDFQKKYQKLVDHLGISNSVTFTGAIPHDSDDLPQLYNLASLFVISSEIESQSMVTLEAMAAGLPVVAADAGALSELVKSGENGYLFSPGESSDLAQYVIKLLKDPELGVKFGEEGKSTVKHHELTKAHGDVMKIYEMVHSGKKT